MTVILTLKIGSGRTRTCSATCHSAKKEKCACICKGKYHGISRGGKEGPKNVEEAEKMLKPSVDKVEGITAQSQLEELKKKHLKGEIKSSEYYPKAKVLSSLVNDALQHYLEQQGVVPKDTGAGVA